MIRDVLRAQRGGMIATGKRRASRGVGWFSGRRAVFVSGGPEHKGGWARRPSCAAAWTATQRVLAGILSSTWG